jgi:DNA-directed RNA polymerase specialized sigma24 family protein
MAKGVTLPEPVTGDANSRAQADRQLIDRCLAGDEEAWQELFARRHPGLVHASRSFLGHRGDGELAEEIAARVWFALLRDGGRTLARFTPARDRDLGAFLSGVARYEVLLHRRSERRRQFRETIAAQTAFFSRKGNSGDVTLLLREFMGTLLPDEAGFMRDILLASSEVKERGSKLSLSQTSVWQRRHRLRLKLLAFLDGVTQKSRSQPDGHV